MSLQDKPVLRWTDAIELYGDPATSKLGRYAHGYGYDEGQDIVDLTASTVLGRPSSHSTKRKRSTDIFGKKGVKEAISREDFSLEDFKKKFIENEQYELLERTIQFHRKRTHLASISRRQLIADNIHNFVKAQCDLRDTDAQFQKGDFPRAQDVKELRQDIDRVRTQMESFFKDISGQQTNASNASMLLSKIQGYSYIFRAASEIDQHRSDGNFDEIARVVEKISMSGSFEGISIFEKALASVKTSLTNVSIALKDKICASNVSNLNRKHCQLLMDINRDGSPMFDILQRLDKKIRKAFISPDTRPTLELLTNQVDVFSEVFPFYFCICRIFSDYDILSFNQYVQRIETIALNLISDFEASSFSSLDSFLHAPRDQYSNISLILHRIALFGKFFNLKKTKATDNQNNENTDNNSENTDNNNENKESSSENANDNNNEKKESKSENPNTHFNYATLKIPQTEYISPNLRLAIKKINDMWKCVKSAISIDSILRSTERKIDSAKNNLQNWYKQVISRQCKMLFKSINPGEAIFSFLIDILQESSVFTSEEWLSLITESIYMLYDGIHSQVILNQSPQPEPFKIKPFIPKSMKNQNQDNQANQNKQPSESQNQDQTNQKMIIESFKGINSLTNEGLHSLAKAYFETTQTEMAPEIVNDLVRVGQELSRLLKERLLRYLNYELLLSMRKSASLEWSNLSKEKIPIKADSWVVFTVSRCVEYRCDWGEVFEDCRNDIIKAIACNFLVFLNDLGSIGPKGRARLELDLELLLYAFADEESDQGNMEVIWNSVKEKIASKGTETKECNKEKMEQLEMMKKIMEQNIKALKTPPPN